MEGGEKTTGPERTRGGNARGKERGVSVLTVCFLCITSDQSERVSDLLRGRMRWWGRDERVVQ